MNANCVIKIMKKIKKFDLVNFKIEIILYIYICMFIYNYIIVYNYLQNIFAQFAISFQINKIIYHYLSRLCDCIKD